eukprot:m51a1_g8785 hypothetical protein (406) ;mRNA; r:212857-214213
MLAQERANLAALTAAIPQSAVAAAGAAIAAVCARANAWHDVAAALDAHVAARRRAAEAYARAMEGLAPLVPPRPASEPVLLPAGTQRNLDLLARVGKTEAEWHRNEAQALAKEAGRACDDLADEVKRLCKRLSAKSESINKVVAEHTKSAKASLAKMSALVEPQASGADGPGAPVLSGKGARDPWAMQLALRSELVGLRAAQKAYCTGASECVAEMEASELKMSKLVADCVLKIAGAMTTASTKIGPDIGVAAKTAAAYTGPDDWKAFKESLSVPKFAAAPASPKEQAPANALDSLLHATAVTQSGELEKETLLSWKKAVVAVTSFGWLHWFSAADKGEPEESVPLARCKVELDVDKRSFKILWDTGSLFNSHKDITFRASTDEAMVDWVALIKRFAAPEPASPK